MKALTVFYSLDGNTRHVAEAVARELKADLLDLKPVADIPSSGPLKILKGGYQVMAKKKPELQPMAYAPSEYDLILIGSPVWAGCYAPALRTFLAGVEWTGKTVALFLTHAGGKGDAMAKLREALSGAAVVGEIDFVSPLKKDPAAAAKRAAEWAREIGEKHGRD